MLALVACFGLACGGFLTFIRSIRGTEHWVMSVSSRADGMTMLVGRASGMLPDAIDDPEFTIVVEGFSPGRDIKPFAIDKIDPQIPDWPIRSGLVDTTILPGSCQLQAGPIALDVSVNELIANGVACAPGGQIRIQVAPAPPSR